MSRSNTCVGSDTAILLCRQPADGSVEYLRTWLAPDAFKSACAFDRLLASNRMERIWSVHCHSDKPYSRPFSLLDQNTALDVVLRLHADRDTDTTEHGRAPMVRLVTDSKYPVPTIRFVLPSPESDDNMSVAADPRTTFGDLYGWLPTPQFNQAVALRSALRASPDLHHSWVPWGARADHDVCVAFPDPSESQDPAQRLAAWVRAYVRDQAHNGDGCALLTVGHNGKRPTLCMRRFCIARPTDYATNLFARAAQIATDPSRADIAALYPHIDASRVDAFETIDIMMPIHHVPHRWAPLATLPPPDAKRTPGRLSAMDGTSLLMAHNSAAMAAPGVCQRLVLQPESNSGAFLWYWPEPLALHNADAAPVLASDVLDTGSRSEERNGSVGHDAPAHCDLYSRAPKRRAGQNITAAFGIDRNIVEPPVHCVNNARALSHYDHTGHGGCAAHEHLCPAVAADVNVHVADVADVADDHFAPPQTTMPLLHPFDPQRVDGSQAGEPQPDGDHERPRADTGGPGCAATLPKPFDHVTPNPGTNPES
ncbi:hypothetical protein pmac_cds_525 [Pandoravirus macleodensis]|uniref:Uncharacterized protein n=1 Tax=Pandoravirus macleodensis TaxID=2107707 RepID=A0A2U7UFG8_9VIRU|nr:hypothetical protein pmac_cds_525 [Pandoravirus macleodensis]AVK77213.1 hypothetical protein pmac_cds_525 [Pandoravirus macleodensis]